MDVQSSLKVWQTLSCCQFIRYVLLRALPTDMTLNYGGILTKLYKIDKSIIHDSLKS